MHSAVISDWRTASAPNPIVASTSYASNYSGPLSVSTHHQIHTSKFWGPSFQVRGVCGNRQRINLVHKVVPGLLALKDVYASIFVLLSSHGGRNSGQIRCSSSSIWRRSSPSANASGKGQPIEELWAEYFADPSQWWDNRDDKRNPRSPDFKHKVTRKVLWVDGWSTPAWVRTRLKSVIQGKSHSHAVDSMHIQSTSTTSEALAILKNLRKQGITIDSYMYVEVLKRCLKQKDLIVAKQAYDCIIKSGMEQNVYVANTLLSVYIRCGRLQDARRVFDELLGKNVFSWTIMIGGYAQLNCAKDALKVFKQMRQEGVQPNEVTYLSILKAFSTPADLKWGKEVHAYIIHDGLESDLRVGTALVHMFAKSGSIDDAQLVFDKMEDRNVITWSAMIGGLADHGRGREAYELFLRMQREGCVPNAHTYVSVLNACASAGALEWVKEVHSHILEAGLESDLHVGSALVHMYAKNGSIDDAQLVFDKMEDRNVITWSAMIGGLADHGRGREAYELFLRMQREGCVPNAHTYVSVLNACASAGALEWVKEVHSHILEAGLESDLHVGSALVHMYAKSGSIDDAQRVFDRMGKRDVITWSAMIGGLADHGRGREALELFRKMNADVVKPDEWSFVSVLSACVHAGLVDEGRRLFSVMSQAYNIKPNVSHCNCMVDLLGRGGHLQEAKRFIDSMPVDPNGKTWGALLGACRTYGNVELGELAANEVFKLEPKVASPYVLLSNIYAAAGKWEEVSLVRTMMQERGICKEPGRSWIEVDDKIHDFVVGDTSHPDAKEIYAELNRLNERIKAEGYIPDTRLVLKNIDEEDKELALCSHSEKLAIAYGLLRIARGKPIRVYKNLRVCSDCHAATKLISKVTGREIVARDANRFHHFKDGVCTCGDYW